MDKLQELKEAMVKARKDFRIKADIVSMYQQKLIEARGDYDLADMKYFEIRKEYDIEKRK